MTEAEELELLELEEAERSKVKAPELPKHLQHGGLIRTPEGRAQESLRALDEQNENTNYGAAAGNALAMGGGTLAKAIPQLAKMTGIKGLLTRGAANLAEGASMGAAQSPDNRLKGAAIGGATQGVLAGGGALTGYIRDLLGKGAKQAAVNKAVNQGKSGEMLLGQADSAANKLRGEISGHEAELGRALSPEGYEVNPDMIAKVFPNYAKKLEAKRPQVAVAQPREMTRAAQQEIPLEGLGTEIAMQPAAQGRVNIGPKQFRRLWKGANKASQFSYSDILNPSAKAKSEAAEALGDTLRREGYGKTPEAEPIMEMMGQDIQAKNYLAGKAVQKNPQAALSAEKLGTKKMEALMDIDRRVGTDLAETGRRMSTARDLTRPLELNTETLGRLAKRGAYATAPGADKLAQFLGKATSPITASSVRQATVGGSSLTSSEAQELEELENSLKIRGR